METVELAKTITPLITFTLGLLATPLVESAKEKAKWKKLRKNLTTELNDELIELPKRLEKMALTLSGLTALKTGKIEQGKPIKYIPRKTELYFLKASTESVFNTFTHDQRYAIKSLHTQIAALDGYVKNMCTREISDTTIDECIKDTKRYLHTGCCMLNTMRIVINHRSAVLNGEDKKIIDQILSEVQINLTYEDLAISNTTTISIT